MPVPKDIGERGKNSLELNSKYPISYRIVIKKSLPLLLFFAAFTALALFLAFAGNPETENEAVSVVQKGVFIGLLIVSVLCLIKLLYETAYRACYKYGIEAGHMVISKGIILKQRGSFPLSRITDVYLDRTFYDFIFGLCNLHVSTPTPDSGKFARIDGLSNGTAVKLQKRLTAILDRSHPEIPRQSPQPPRAPQAANTNV